VLADTEEMAITGRAGPGRSSTATAAPKYTYTVFARFCAGHSVATSVGWTGACWDNTASKSEPSAMGEVAQHDGR